MNKLIEYGVRFTDDPSEWGVSGPYLFNSLRILKDYYEGTGKRFFFDTAGIDQKEIGGVKVQNLFGWIVPERNAESFEGLWLKLRDDEIDQPYALIGWTEGPDGKPAPVIDTGE